MCNQLVPALLSTAIVVALTLIVGALLAVYDRAAERRQLRRRLREM